MSLGNEDHLGWSQSKRYAAALFYLSNVHSNPINEAQWARLNALQMLIAYGKFSNSVHPQEFVLCSAQERKKREEDWKSVSHLQKSLAMQQFLDIMDNLFPIWWRTRAVLEDFDGEWGSLATLSGQESVTSCKERSSALEKSEDRKRIRLRRSGSRNAKESKSSYLMPTALEKLQTYEFQQLTSTLPKLPKLNAIQDAASTLSRLKGSYEAPRKSDPSHDSKYYQLQRSTREDRESTEELPRQILSGLYETLSSGKPTTKRETEFLKNLVTGVVDNEGMYATLVEKLEEAKKQPHLPANLTYPTVNSVALEELLRPRLSLPLYLLKVLEPFLCAESQALPSLFPLFLKDLHQCIDSLFAYVQALEQRTMAAERKLEDMEFDYDTTVVTLEAIVELYSLKNRKSVEWALSTVDKSQYQVEVCRGLLILKGENANRLRRCEAEMSEMMESLIRLEKELIETSMDRDKLKDYNRLIEMSVYYGVENTFKGKNIGKSLLQTASEEKAAGQKVTQELAKLKAELAETKRENDLLHNRMKGMRRSSILIAEEDD